MFSIFRFSSLQWHMEFRSDGPYRCCVPHISISKLGNNTGCVQDLVDTYQYVAQFPAAFAPLKGQFNLSAISDLYNKTDFIGISSYPSLTPNFTLPQLEAATEQFDFEIGQFGVDLKDLVVNKVRRSKML